ncbi:MAG: GFA family protein [Proteobacteria bacterium]|nr:GFA family protein [Pseudomonadota bacterium]
MSARYTGGCACGAIRYEIAAEPMKAGHCQCRDCQRATGAGHGSFMAFPDATLKLTGTPKYHEVKADSGNTVRRGFCPNCGSFLLGRNSGMTGMVAICAASLDDPTVFKPQMLLYASSGQAWDHVDPALPRFPKMPPMAR